MTETRGNDTISVGRYYAERVDNDDGTIFWDIWCDYEHDDHRRLIAQVTHEATRDEVVGMVQGIDRTRKG